MPRLPPWLRYWRRRSMRVRSSFKHLSSRQKILVSAIIGLAIFAIVRRLHRLSPSVTSTNPDDVTLFRTLVAQAGCRIISRESSSLVPYEANICPYKACGPYTELITANDTKLVIRQNANSKLCKATICCAAVYSMPRRNYDEIRYPARGCHPLDGSQEIHPSVYSQVLETACEDLCDNRRVVNFYPLFAPSNKVEQKLRAWQNRHILAHRAPRVILLILNQVTLDSAHRFLPQTMEQTKEMHWLQGISMVESTLNGNLLATLTGHNESHLLGSKCSLKSLGVFDGCPFIWKAFRNLDYVTAYVDQFRLKGGLSTDVDFLAQPTDYYIPPAFIQEKMEPTQKEPQLYNSFASTSPSDFVLTAAESFAVQFRNVPFFGVFRIAPTDTRKLDTKLATVLKTLKQIPSTLTILTSIVPTAERTRRPFLYLSVPPNLKPAFAKLRFNSQRLTTPFDIHRTLRQVALETCNQLGMEENDCFSASSGTGVPLNHVISSNRTCQSAGIPPELCPCH